MHKGITCRAQQQKTASWQKRQAQQHRTTFCQAVCTNLPDTSQKQGRCLQGTTAENNLLAGAARAVHWSDINQKDLRLCLRLQETGQQWSGGFALDTPGDLFVKIRHRSVLTGFCCNGLLQLCFDITFPCNALCCAVSMSGHATVC